MSLFSNIRINALHLITDVCESLDNGESWCIITTRYNGRFYVAVHVAGHEDGCEVIFLDSLTAARYVTGLVDQLAA